MFARFWTCLGVCPASRGAVPFSVAMLLLVCTVRMQRLLLPFDSEEE